MNKKIFGIYISYPPRVDLRSEGLGRLMMEMIKALLDSGEAKVLIACPEWSVSGLRLLFEDAKVDPSNIELLTTRKSPALLSLYLNYLTRRSRKRTAFFKKPVIEILQSTIQACLKPWQHALASIRSLPVFLLFTSVSVPLLVVLGGVLFLLLMPLGVALALRRTLEALSATRLSHRLSKLSLFIRDSLFSKSDFNSPSRRLFRLMEEKEATLLANIVNDRKDVQVWYSPTAFWPEFNLIRSRRLMCVPDVVMNDFPVAFSNIEGEQFLYSHSRIERSIKEGDHFIVYSDYVKWHTLVDRYAANPDNVHVIRHGANRLDSVIDELSNQNDATELCRDLFKSAIRKAIDCPNASLFSNGTPKFIFYASQIRPNKNVVSLLRAYRHLLRQSYIPHKLVLTGNPYIIPEVKKYIEDNSLGNDVLFLHGLSSQELAACYKLADLAVNPSLSEGGCPFTFTEALSVGTPVVMARIAVTEEVISDCELQKITLFDPYNWREMADKIHWALCNSEQMRKTQGEFYQTLKQRSWAQVSADYIDLLGRIAS